MKSKIIAVLLGAVLLTGCGQKSPETPPAVEIDAGGVSVSNTVNISAWDNTVYLINGTSSDWLGKYGEPVFFPLGTIFRVTIPEKTATPDSVTVTDTLIREDGTPKYDKKAAVNVLTPEIDGNVVSFSLDNHWAAMLSSNSEDYQEGAIWRCFEITCTWGENVCIYTFCVRTNPAVIMDIEQ
ncbi:MAG: lipoprotein [Oscillospiraceae bacterium]|nr:lipoprotein [Oscillospiraceae bacterium]